MRKQTFLILAIAILGIAIGFFTDIQLFKALEVERGHFLLGITGGILAAKLVDLLSGELEFSMDLSQLTIAFLFGVMIGIGLGFNFYYSLPSFLLFGFFYLKRKNLTSLL